MHAIEKMSDEDMPKLSGASRVEAKINQQRTGTGVRRSVSLWLVLYQYMGIRELGASESYQGKSGFQNQTKTLIASNKNFMMGGRSREDDDV